MFGVHPELHIGPMNMLRKEEVKISNPVWHIGQNRANCPEISRTGVACIPLGIDEIILQIADAIGMG